MHDLTSVPRIGIPVRLPGALDDASEAIRAAVDLVFKDVVNLIEAAGMEAVLLDSRDVSDAGALERCDGFVLPGGGDVDPCRYGGPTDDPTLFGVDAGQDSLDEAVARFALDTGRPLLCICRGMQLLNVIMGGSLHVDLAPGELAHSQPFAGELKWTTHEVSVKPGSRVARAFGDRATLLVEGAHHQGIDRLASDLCGTGWAADGCVEAVETVDPDAWVVGVQWHPEARTPVAEPDRLRLFTALADQARAFHFEPDRNIVLT